MSELRRFNDFIMKESTSFGPKQRMNLNSYKQALQINIEKFSFDKTSYQKRNNYMEFSQRTA